MHNYTPRMSDIGPYEACNLCIEHLETHRLALAIAKKTLDKNRFTATQKTLPRDNPAFQVGNCVYFKNKQPGK